MLPFPTVYQQMLVHLSGGGKGFEAVHASEMRTQKTKKNGDGSGPPVLSIDLTFWREAEGKIGQFLFLRIKKGQNWYMCRKCGVE